jgi:hypothetical protein
MYCTFDTNITSLKLAAVVITSYCVRPSTLYTLLWEWNDLDETRYIRNKTTFKTAIKYSLLNAFIDSIELSWSGRRWWAGQPPYLYSSDVSCLPTGGGMLLRCPPPLACPPLLHPPSAIHTFKKPKKLNVLKSCANDSLCIWDPGRQHRHPPQIWLLFLNLPNNKIRAKSNPPSPESPL